MASRPFRAMTLYPAPAKLNLYLRIVGRRPDGYHLLQTVFRFIDWSDVLGFSLRQDGTIRLKADLPGVPPEGNLVYRAARLLKETSGCRLGADIALTKKIPLGGGLGGGSSDAATTLLALNRLWGLNLPRARLLELALRLGADVPVFVFGENAFAEGVGEKLTPIALPPAWYLVAVPPLAVSTAEVFASPELTRNAIPIKILDFSMQAGRNDLEPVVRRKYPAVERCFAWLGQHGKAALTGAGGCVFASFETEEAARQVLVQMPAGMEGFVARGLDRHPLRDLAE